MLSWFGGVFCQWGSVCVISYRKIKRKEKKITHGPRDIVVSWALLGVGPLSYVASLEGLAGAA
jgi:hypothetical protein